MTNLKGLNHFVYNKEILIDDAGWGDLILGVVIGALKLPDRKYMERRIPTSSFQSPKFENKRYLYDGARIAEEILDVMEANKETIFKVCSGYILSSVRRFLVDAGFRVEKTEIKGELQERVEKGFGNWCEEVGVPVEKDGKRNFYGLLDWVGENLKTREKLVKTGWKSWNSRWRKRAYEIGVQKAENLEF